MAQENPTFHPTARKKVMATADIRIQQVQIADKTGKIRRLLVWQCGPDVVYANTMDGLFDEQRRRAAPAWVVDQMKALPPQQQFAYDGAPKVSTHDTSDYLPEDDDDDVPEFMQK